jgi:hypothetical protein
VEIERRSLSNLEERGLDTLFIAIGFATWPASDGGSATEAPVILAPAVLKRQGREGSQVVMALSGELRINPVLLQKLESDFGLGLSGEKFLPTNQGSDHQAQFSPRDVLQRLRRAAAKVDGFRATYDAALGNFAFYKMAMVEDLSPNRPGYTKVISWPPFQAIFPLDRRSLPGERESTLTNWTALNPKMNFWCSTPIQANRRQLQQLCRRRAG